MDGANADAWRDALAILAAALEGDEEGVGAVVIHCDVHRVIGALSSMLFEVLRDRDIDPAGWVADQQARSRDELGGGVADGPYDAPLGSGRGLACP